MNVFWALLLGIIQGLTEFIPVSSSGHLVLAQTIISDFEQPGVLFEVFLHAGTLLSIIFYFRKIIFRIKLNYWLLIFLATIPAGLFGFFFQSPLESLFESSRVVGFALIITAILNFLTDKVNPSKGPITSKNAFLIGIAQAVAIVPGISRSGTTIFAGSALGIEKKEAAKFSFLLSVPAVVGANLLQFYSHGSDRNGNPALFIVGFFAAFVSGYFAIKVVYKFLTESKFKYFALYTLFVGVLALIF